MGIPIFAVQCALPSEAAKIVDTLQDVETQIVCRNRVSSGTYAGVHVVVCVGGMGVANAAAASQFMIDRYQPQVLVFSGIAGSINPGLGIGDVIIASQQHYAESNMDVISDCEPYLRFFTSDSGLVEDAARAAENLGFARIASQSQLRESSDADAGRLAVEVGGDDQHRPSYVVGNISTSDRFNTDVEVLRSLVRRFDAEGEAMEEAAAGQICAKCGVPFLCVRGVSNPCGEQYDDLNMHERNMQLAADAAGSVTLGVIGQHRFCEARS